MRSKMLGAAFLLLMHGAVASPLRAQHLETGLERNGFRVSVSNSSKITGQEQNGECIKATGGTCVTSNCAEWRGPTECSYTRCFCTSGCASVGGECHDEANKLLLSGFTIRNMRYPEYYMYAASHSTSLKVAKGPPGPESKFDLYLLPGQSGQVEEFVLVSQKYPSYAVYINEDEVCEKRKRTGCRKTYDGKVRHMSRGADASVTQVATKFVQAPGSTPEHSGAFMIGSYDYSGKYLYVGRGSWGVQAKSGDSGTGSYWISDPPLKVALGAYHGRRCSWDCGAAAAKSIAAANSIAGAVLALLLGLALGN